MRHSHRRALVAGALALLLVPLLAAINRDRPTAAPADPWPELWASTEPTENPAIAALQHRAREALLRLRRTTPASL
jgi:hypothetical protein